MEFDLNIAFTSDQLQILYITGTNVVVAKPAAGGGIPNVAWQVFKPLMGNTISWEESYGIYASTASVSGGARLNKLSWTPPPAADSKLYTLQDSGSITGPGSGGSANSFSLLNQFSNVPYVTVGLYQDATVNGTAISANAISAAPVMLQSTAVMTPFTTVYIWLQSNVQSNCVVTTVTSPMTSLTFGGGVTSQSVAYDSVSGKFLPASAHDSHAIQASRQQSGSVIAHIEAIL